MDKAHIDRMMVASHLIEPPAAEVVNEIGTFAKECIDHITEQDAKIERMVKSINELIKIAEYARDGMMIPPMVDVNLRIVRAHAAIDTPQQ